MSDIIVNDEEYQQLATLYNELSVLMDEHLITYTDILKDATEVAIPSGNVHDNLLTYQVKVSTLHNQLKQTLISLRDFCNGYLSDIDEADGELYN